MLINVIFRGKYFRFWKSSCYFCGSELIPCSMSLKKVGLIAALGLGVAGCGKFNLHLINYKVTPNPLELHNDSVTVTIAAEYPAKVMPRKGTAVVTPVLRYKGGERAFQSVTFQGDRAAGNGEVVRREGGSIKAYKATIPFTDAMEVSELHVTGTGTVNGKEKKSESTTEPIALGVITTPRLVQNNSARFAPSANNYGPVYKSQKVTIYFAYNSAVIRPNERKSDEMKAFRAFVDAHMANGSVLEKVDIQGWASPDGEEDKNLSLSNARAEVVRKMFVEYFTKEKKVSTVQFSAKGNGEDRAGFSTRMNQANVDKKSDVSSQINSGARNAELRRYGVSIYNTLEKEVLGPLRRVEVTLTVKEREKTNDELLSFAKTSPEKLNIEELLYTAEKLAATNEEKLQILANAQRQFPEDARAFNNRGVVLAEMNRSDEALQEFLKAEKLAPSEGVYKANIGGIYLRKGDRAKALEYLNQAKGSGKAADFNLATIYISQAKYSEAVSLFAGDCSFNAALAQILAGSPEKASATLDCSSQKDEALSYYLRAIAAARTKSNQAVFENLRMAVQKDPSLKAKARTDLEFLKLRENSEFTGIVN